MPHEMHAHKTHTHKICAYEIQRMWGNFVPKLPCVLGATPPHDLQLGKKAFSRSAISMILLRALSRPPVLTENMGNSVALKSLT